MVYDKARLANLSMPQFSRKKLLLIGFLFVIILVIPLTVYLVQQQQESRSRATPNTTLSFIPATQSAPVGENVSYKVAVSPGANQVNFIKLAVKYDSTKLEATKDSFELNPASNLSIIQGTDVSVSDLITVTLSVQADPTKVIQCSAGTTCNPVEIGTLTFKVIGEPQAETTISFDTTQVQIRSINGANKDAFNENVFQGGGDASLTITGEVTPTVSVSPEPSTSPEPTETLTPEPTETPTPLPSGVTATPNEAPVCDSLTADQETTGDAPLSLTFTASGSDSDGTISKVTFNFGEGAVEDVTSGEGIGTATVSASKAHTYQNGGTFTASALLTDDKAGLSSTSTCTVAVTVAGATPTAVDNSLPPTGPRQTILGVGALGGVLFLIGALLFLAL